MSVALLEDNTLEKARGLARVRQTDTPDFIEWMAKAFTRLPVVYAYGQPESDGDLTELDTDRGPMLLVYLPDLRKARFSENTKTRGRGKNKYVVHTERVSHKLPKQKPVPVLPGRRAPGMTTSPERMAAIQAEVNAAVGPTNIPASKPNRDSAKVRKPVNIQSVARSVTRAPKPPDTSGDYSKWKAPSSLESAQPKGATPMHPGANKPHFSEGGKNYRVHQATGNIHEVMPGEYWVTVKDAGNPQGHPILIQPIPGHPGEGVTLTPFGSDTARMLPIRTTTTEDALADAARRQEERKQARREAAMTKTAYSSRMDQEKLASRNTKNARMAEVVAARLYKYGHAPYGPCTNTDAGEASCAVQGQKTRIPRVHLLTREQIQAARAEGERPLSEHAVSQRWGATIEAEKRFVRMLARQFHGYSTKVAHLPSVVSDNPEALSAFLSEERQREARLHIQAAASIQVSIDKTEKQLEVAEEALAKLEKAPKDKEPETVTCPECAGATKVEGKPCQVCKGVGMVSPQEHHIVEAKERVESLLSSMETFQKRKDAHQQMAALNSSEMPPVVLMPAAPKIRSERKRQPEWRAMAERGKGDAEEWAAAKPEISVALASRKAYWAGRVILLNNEIREAEFGQGVLVDSPVPPHIQRREAVKGLKEQFKHAKVTDEAFLDAQRAMLGDDARAAMQAVNHAFMQEQRQPESAIAAARIKNATPPKKGKMQDLPTSKPVLGAIDPATLAELAKQDAILEAETRRIENAYAPKQPGVHPDDEHEIGSTDQRLPATYNYGEPISEADIAKIQKSYERDYLKPEIQQAVWHAYAPIEAEDILGLTGRGKEEAKILADGRAEGLFAAIHSISLGMTRGAMMDRRITTLLGPVGAAAAMRAFVEQKDPDKATEMKVVLRDWVQKNTLPKLQAARETYQGLIEDAREARAAMTAKMKTYAAKPDEPVRGPQASELQYEQREMFERIVTAFRHVATTYGEVQGVNVVLGALERKPPEEIPVRVGANLGFERKDLTQALQFYGLKPVIDYRIENVDEEPLVHVKYSSMSKFVRPRQPLVEPDRAAELERLHQGDASVVEKGFVPAGFRAVTHTAAEGFEVQRAAEVLAGIKSAGDIEGRVQDAIGTLAMYGLGHRQIRSLMHEDKLEERVPPAFRPVYSAMVERLLPSADYAADRRAATRASGLTNRVVDRLRAERGLPKTEADAQTLDETAAEAHLDAALKVLPFGHLAYKDVNLLSGVEKDVLRRFWADEIAGSPYVVENGEDDAGRKAWQQFLSQAGGESEALGAAQDLLKDELLGQYLYHSTASQMKNTPEGQVPSGVSPKVAEAPIRHGNLMDRAEHVGPRAGLLNRRHLGAIADKQIERLLHPKGKLASRYDVRQRPVQAIPGRLDMESENFAHQQMAIRAFPIAKRMAVLTDTGTGKFAIALGGLTEAMATGQVKRSVFMLPRKMTENYKAQGDIVKFTHADSGLKWFAKAGATQAERFAAMRDPNINLYITTPESFRDDLLDIVDEHHYRNLDAPSTPAQARGMAAPKTPEERVSRRQMLEKRLAELPDEDRANIVQQALAKAGVSFDHAFADEAHRWAERAGKETSRLTLMNVAFTDKLPYFMLATASPAQNDMSEAMDLTRKVRPDIFSRKKGQEQTPYEWLYENYRSLGLTATRGEVERKAPHDPDPLLVQALRREVAPFVFMATTDDPERPNYSEEPVDLTGEQMRSLEAVDRASAKAYRIDTQEGRDALRFLNPDAFREGEMDIPKGSTEEYKRSSRQAMARETLRREAMHRVLYDTPIERNAYSQKVAQLVRNDKRFIDRRTGRPSSGIVFTNRVNSATQLAAGLNERAKQEGWKNFQAYALDFTTSPRDVETAEKDYQESTRSGKQVVLVASPAHSESKDYPEGQWAIHYDLPNTLAAMDQREGRLRIKTNRNGELQAVRLVGHYRDQKGQRHKHESELQSEQVLRGKAPLQRLFRRTRDVSMSDDLTRMFAANRLLKT